MFKYANETMFLKNMLIDRNQSRINWIKAKTSCLCLQPLFISSLNHREQWDSFLSPQLLTGRDSSCWEWTLNQWFHLNVIQVETRFNLWLCLWCAALAWRCLCVHPAGEWKWWVDSTFLRHTLGPFTFTLWVKLGQVSPPRFGTSSPSFPLLPPPHKFI